jgi:hypothetical protein
MHFVMRLMTSCRCHRYYVKRQEPVLKGSFNGHHYRLGHADFALPHPQASDRDRLWLSDEDGAIAWFMLSDTLRPEASYRHPCVARRRTENVAAFR